MSHMAGTPDPILAESQPVRNRLPTLFEVLSRRTLSPVDLYSFYIYMRDQQHAVDYLDFWLDVSQHLSLCRHYVSRLHRSVIEDTPENKSGSKRSSQVLNDVGLSGPSGEKNSDGRTPEQRLSAFLRSETGSRHHSPANSQGSHETGMPPTPGTDLLPRPSFMTSLSGSNDNSPGNGSGGIIREDLRASAEKILYTYLLSGAEREIILPPSIVNEVTEAIEGTGQRDDPEVFDAAKDYVFQAMERDAFPGFLRSKALGNVVPPSMFFRIVLGLLSLFGGFWTAFVLIFLNASRLTRCWEILPFTIGVYFCFTHQYMLDPLLVLFGFSEYTFMNFNRIREPFVKKLLTKRAYMVLLEVVLVDAAICCLFIFVPGKRL